MKTKLFKWCLIAPIGISIIPSFASCSIVEDIKNRPRQIDGFDWIGRKSGLIDPQFYRVNEEEKKIFYWNLTRIHAKDLIIPNYVMYRGEKYKVILDPQAFYEAKGSLVGSIELNDWCDTIPDECFYDDYMLSKVIFHVYPKKICHQAFYHCSALKEIVVKKEDGTFDTNWVEEIATIEDQAFWAASVKGQISFGPSLTSIGVSAFEGDYLLQSLDFTRTNEEFKVISPSAFQSCSGLTDVYFSKYIDVIGDSAFGECQSLKNVYFAADDSGYKKISKIDNAAFAKCDMFSGFKPLPGKNLTLYIDELGVNCFQYDKAFKIDSEMTWISNLESLPTSTFEGCGITRWKFTEHLSSIGSSALAFNTDLYAIDLPPYFEGYDVPTPWWSDPFATGSPSLKNVFLGCAERGRIYVDESKWDQTQRENWIRWFKQQGIIIGSGHWLFEKPEK